MTKLKTINIKGKKYVEVNERLKYFRENHPDYSLTTAGSSAMVDGDGTTVTEGDLAGGSAIGGPDGSSEVFGNTVYKTGSTTVFTEETKAGTSSGSAQILVGVTTAVS